MAKKIKHPVVTVSLGLICRADEKDILLESLNEWFFSRYTEPAMQATGKPKVSKRREASKKQVEYFWDGEDDEEGEE